MNVYVLIDKTVKHLCGKCLLRDRRSEVDKREKCYECPECHARWAVFNTINGSILITKPDKHTELVKKFKRNGIRRKQ